MPKKKKKRKTQSKKQKFKNKILKKLFNIILILLFSFVGYTYTNVSTSDSSFKELMSELKSNISSNIDSTISTITSYTSSDTIVIPSSTSIEDIPAYSDSTYVILENNIPDFSDEYDELDEFEYYSDLDYLGRCQVAFANLCIDTMPTEDRESISSVEPSGWQSITYDIVDGKYLYNRSHLIGFQLAGENANENNLITGTRYFNVEGMLPFENKVAEYILDTQNHVLYRVTPIYEGTNLIANGVQMEAESLEDDGEGILFNVFIYNVQPDITINYSNGNSYLSN